MYKRSCRKLGCIFSCCSGSGALEHVKQVTDALVGVQVEAVVLLCGRRAQAEQGAEHWGVGVRGGPQYFGDLLSEDMRSSRPGMSPWMPGREKSGRPPQEPTETLAIPGGWNGCRGKEG